MPSNDATLTDFHKQVFANRAGCILGDWQPIAGGWWLPRADVALVSDLEVSLAADPKLYALRQARLIAEVTDLRAIDYPRRFFRYKKLGKLRQFLLFDRYVPKVVNTVRRRGQPNWYRLNFDDPQRRIHLYHPPERVLLSAFYPSK